MRTFQGVLLFAFIPLVLFLFLRQPIGPAVSVIAGLVIMFGHRFLAAPWMARHATERCLWCGREVNGGERFAVSSGGRSWTMAACGPAHRSRSGRFLTFASRSAAPIAIGIFVPLALLLAGSLAIAAGYQVATHEWNAWQFRMIVAFTVAGASVAYPAVKQPDEPLACPFPLHNLFLLGIRQTLWIFRLVGAWWIVSGSVMLVRALRTA